MHFFRFLRDAPYFARWAQYGLLAPYWLCQYGLLKPYFARWAQYGLLAPYWLCQYGLLAVLCAHFVARIRTAFGALLALPIRAFGRAMCSLRCAHTHGFWRPIGFANTGF